MMNETSSINNLEDRVIDVLNELKSNPVNS